MAQERSGTLRGSYRGVLAISNLRTLTRASLRTFAEPCTIMAHSEPVAVIVPYEWYLEAQDLLKSARNGLKAGHNSPVDTRGG